MDKNSLGELKDEDWLVKEKNASVRLCNKLKKIIQKNNEIQESTVKIQSLQRDRKARRVYQEKKESTDAAIKIQAIQRGRKARAKQIQNKINKATTDSLPWPNIIDDVENRPESKNLIGIYSILMNNTRQKTIDEVAGKNFSAFKKKLSEIVVNEINPISLKIKELLDDKVFLEKILKDGYEKANEIASKKIKKIHEIVGF